jgi:hypothetical protein
MLGVKNSDLYLTNLFFLLKFVSKYFKLVDLLELKYLLTLQLY